MKAHAFGLCFCFALSALTSPPSPAQTTVSLPYSFTGLADGAQPNSIIQAQDGNYYGTTAYGGASCTINPGASSSGKNVKSTPPGCGTIFRLNPNGNGTFTFTTLYEFSGGTDGGVPTGILQGPDGNLYGTTVLGGQTTNAACLDETDSNSPNPVGCGTIFEISPSNLPASGKLVPIYSFKGGNDGAYPNPLTLGAAGVIYGSSQVCSTCKGSALGTLFSFTPPSGGPGTSVSINPFFTFGTNGSSFAYPNALVEVAIPINAQPSAQTNLLYGAAQLGGDTATSAGCLTNPGNSEQPFGCGGVFSYNLSTNKENDVCVFGQSANVTSSSGTSTSMRDGGGFGASPRVIMGQSTGRFPTGGGLWNFDSAPVTLAIGGDANIYGTTPPGCLVLTSSPAEYNVETSCSGSGYSNQNIQDIVYQCIPPSPTSTSQGTLNTIYQFTGASDGGGSLQGLLLASDGNFYGTSGDVVFDLTPSQMSTFTSSSPTKPTAPLATLTQFGSSLASGYSPNSLIQGIYSTSGGKTQVSFFGTTAAGGAKGFGAVFEVTTSLAIPVQLTVAPSTIALNNSATLTWTVPNAFSLTAQQCYAFVEGSNASTAGAWSGLRSGTMSGSNYTSSTTITPTATGTYIYALTCGGTVTGSAILTVLPSPQVTVSPSTSSITATQSMTVKVTLAGTPTPTGTVTVTGGNYTSAAATLSSGSATITIAADTLAAGSYTFKATYTPDTASSSTYASSSGTASSAVTVSAATPTVTVTPGASSISTAQALAVTVGVSGGSGNPTATGSVTLSGGSYTSSPTALSTGSATINIPSGTLAAGSYSFKATYTPDTSSSSTYGTASGTASSAVNVTNPTYSMSSTAATVSPGGSASSTITVNSSNGYAGTVALTCSVTAQPSGATDIPTCNGGQLTMSSTATTMTTTITMNTTAATAKLERPYPGTGAGWAGGGAMAFVVILLTPRKSRKWLAIMIGCIFIANMTACGGGSKGSTTPSNPGTTVGNYTITISGAGSDSAKTTASTTFTLTVT